MNSRRFLVLRHASHLEAPCSGVRGPAGGRGVATRLIARVLAAGLVCFFSAEAAAQSLQRGDLALGVYQSVAKYNRYWYHYNGDTDCNGLPCSRANLNSYDAIDVPEIGGRPANMAASTLALTGFGAEYGVLDQLVLSLGTELAYTSPSSRTVSLGDTRLGATWQVTPDAPLVLSLDTTLKLPGTYDPNAIVAAGGGQTDLSVGGVLWGHGFRRKLIYNVAWGYRFRFPFADPVFVTVSNDAGTIVSTPVVGPADEVYLNFTAGVFASRKTYLFLNGSINNAFGGVTLDDYYSTVFAAEETDAQGAPVYQVDGDPSDLLTVMEEDYILLGFGVLFRVRYSATLYLNYSLKVLGQNTPAFFVPDGTRIPIGKMLVGLEYTFGTRGPGEVTARAKTHARAPRLASLRPGALAGTRD